MIFFTVTGSIASGIIYDKYQTRRTREKWCNLVTHIADEHMPTKTMPRKMTVYLAAPPGDGLRAAREHFHNYVKPVLVAAAMDWDVVEGRKEGDVRYKTAERIRKKRKRSGEGEPLSQEDAENHQLTVEGIREKNGTMEYDGIAGDLVIGRNTWKEYVRGLHEGWLGPVDAPKQPQEGDAYGGPLTSQHVDGHASFGDTAVEAATNAVSSSSPNATSLSSESSTSERESEDDGDPKPEEEKKEEEDKPKPRQPPPYIQPLEYPSATPSRNTPDLLGPSTGIRFPHILGFRNTPVRIYRFFTRRHLADSTFREVAAAVLASYRPFPTTLAREDDSASSDSNDIPEQRKVLKHEERDWWKTTFKPRQDHEESVWIEDMVLDERLANRMRAFQLTAEHEDRAKRLGDGTDKVVKGDAGYGDS